MPFSRSGRQCSDRYRMSLDPNIRRSKWTEEEDRQLTNAVETIGMKWSQVRTFVPGRTGPQCRDRWTKILDPSLNKAEWSDEVG